MEYNMTYENIPKNLTEQAVLVRDGRADYLKLEADPFPVPTTDESGATLEITDTGDRYRWTSTNWVKTHTRGMNNPIEISDRGDLAIPVFVQDQTTEMLDLVFIEEKVTGLTLNTDTVIDTRTVTLSSGHGLTTANSFDHLLEISNIASQIFYRGRIVTVVGDVVTLSPALDNIFTVAGSTLLTGNPNMVQDTATGNAIDGSVTPVIFSVKPIASQSGDITKVIVGATSSNESDLTTIGGAPGLAIGLLLRAKRPNGTFKNLFSYRNNFDIVLHGFEIITLTPKAGNATRGFAARVVFAGQEQHGVTLRLDGALGEELQLVIYELMDNTGSGNITMSFTAQGHELQL